MLTLTNVCKSFQDADGQTVDVLKDLNLTTEAGEFITLFGPNGCGKSTLMSLIVGIEQPTSGSILYHSEQVEIGYVFQDYKASLLPWKTVLENIALPLIWKGMKPKRSHERVINLVETFKLNVNLKAYPFTLSGGQAQLVSILRSLVVNPDILILDEPASALDYLNSMNLLMELQQFWVKLNFTALFISHDIEEALFLGDRLVLLSPKPTAIVDVIDINLPRPRTLDVFTDPNFVKLKRRALESLYPMMLPSSA